MTEFFTYETLTWPEVAALPRCVPLVLPLGQGYPLAQLASALGDPPRAGLLPPIPFGWRGSGLAVPEPVLGSMLSNLLASLRDDGFTRVHALLPQSLDPQFAVPALAGEANLVQAHNSGRQEAPRLPPEQAREHVILLPVGHTEQHGHHLPLYLVARGFDRFYFLSGHGGNMSFLVNVVKYAGERHRRVFCATAFLHTSGHRGAPAIDAHRQSEIGGMGHAGELETSFMLHLRPDLCHMQRAVDETDFIATPNYYMDWIEGGALIANPPWDDDTRTGAYGAGSLGSAEKGRLWLEAAILEKTDHVEEIHTQHDRREQRRKEGFGLWGKG